MDMYVELLVLVPYFLHAWCDFLPLLSLYLPTKELAQDNSELHNLKVG